MARPCRGQSSGRRFIDWRPSSMKSLCRNTADMLARRIIKQRRSDNHGAEDGSSFLLEGGFESSCHITTQGRGLDRICVTEHVIQADGDYVRLRSVGFATPGKRCMGTWST